MNIINVWLALPLQKRILSIASAIGTLAFLYLLATVTMKPKMGLLYSGLDSATAGEVIARLDTLDAKYDVRGNAIYTEINRRDSLRLELAREGLPKQSVVGYELFDDMNSFAMSSEMFDATYWRAKEGELSRTLLAMPNIKAARVHLGTQKASGFSRGPKAASASVTVSTSSGVTSEQAKAIQFLTALSVVGLKPEDVAVIDTVRGLVVGPGLDSVAQMGGDTDIERASKLKENLLSILEARVGPGNARVSVSLDLDRTRESLTERTFDPDGRVLKSQTTTDSSNSSNGQNAAVTVASNLPEGEGGANNSSSERTETTETVSYEISEILRNREIMPGSIKRMTVAVLVDHLPITAEDGTITREPRTEEELDVLRELVASASGLDEERGDQLTVSSLAFSQPIETDFVVKPSLIQQFVENYLWSTIQSLILAIVALVLGLFVVKPLLTQRSEGGAGNLEDLSSMTELLPMSLATAEGAANAEALALEGGSGQAGALGGALGQGGMGQHAIGQAAPPLAITGAVGNDPVDLLNARASEQIDDAADLLASWLSADAKAS